VIVFILNILFACTHLCAGEYKNPTLEIINSIPQQDREEIKSLFKNLFKIHTFAYSLYGDKPMTYGDVCLEGNSLFWTYEICQLDQLYKEILEIYSEPCVLTKKRWEIWKKYNNRFRMKKYLLMEKSIYRLEELKNKLNLANNKLQSLHEHDPYIIASINRVCFVADTEHDETVKLRKKYDNLNRKINEIYSREDWFEQTLIQLTSD
jgi:hypothetical protein